MKNALVDDARAAMLAAARPLESELVPLSEALGRTLAETVAATRDQPPFDASAMDGYAVRSVDAVQGAILPVVGESAAGGAHETGLQPGEAVRIFTGAPVPDGADTVIIQENVTRQDGVILIDETAEEGRHIRPACGDFREGDVLLEPGVRLDPWRISLAAAAGQARVEVARRPRVALLSTGEEIVTVGESPGPFQIFNSGGPALAALVTQWGGEPVLMHPAGDNADVIAAAVRDAGCDVVVTIGGASVGDHDLVKPALETLGLDLVFDKLKMRPGKPTSFGTLSDGRYVLGLPGNPASALVCAELFLKGLIAHLSGRDANLGLVTARLTMPLPANGFREHWMRATLTNDTGTLMVTPLGDQDSSLVSVFAKSEALLRRECDAPEAKAGEAVQVQLLERL